MDGITGVSLANNHIFDNGLEVALDTIKNLDEKGIQHTGVGRNKSEAFSPIRLNINGYDLDIISLTSEARLSKSSKEFYNNIALIEDDLKLRQVIEESKKSSEPVIALPHLGVEYVDFPSVDTIKKYRHLIDMGVDIVIGTHPHVIQGSETYKNGLIFYSLGDFVFDSLYSKRKESLVVSFNLSHKPMTYTTARVVKNDKYLPELKQDRYENSRRWRGMSIRFTKLYGYKYKVRFILGKIQYQIFLFTNTIKHKGLMAGFRLLISKFGLVLKMVKK
jgi:poly-gamma-glutamate synthesis protein (capsule biosynthesis protein)